VREDINKNDIKVTQKQDYANISPFDKLEDVIKSHKNTEDKFFEDSDKKHVYKNPSNFLEDFITSIAKPVIQKWIDEKMLGIVKEMVAKEIEKIRKNI
jgi:cell pole-organizing protein PopZ